MVLSLLGQEHCCHFRVATQRSGLQNVQVVGCCTGGLMMMATMLLLVATTLLLAHAVCRIRLKKTKPCC